MASPLAILARLSLLALLLTGSACVHAVHLEGPSLVGPSISFEAPPGWMIQRNYRFLGSNHIEICTPDGRVAITLELLRASEHFRELPLDLIAEGIIGERDRGFGVETLALQRNEILIAGRRGVTLTGRRVHGPQIVDFTSIVARTDTRLLIVLLHAPEGRLGDYTLALERIIDTLALPREAPASARLEEW